MNFSYLTIFLLLILFFLYLKLESNNKLNIYSLGIIVVLLVHELYMYIGLNKTENFQVRIGNGNIDINNDSIEPINLNRTLNSILIDNNKYNLSTTDLIEIVKFIDFTPVNDFVLAYNNKLNVNSKNAFLFNDDGDYKKTIQISESNDKYDSSALYYSDYVLVACGISYDNHTISNTINFYNIETNTLSLVELSKGRYKMSASQDQDYIVFAFGINDSNNISKIIDYYVKAKDNILNKSNWESITCPYPGKLYCKVLIHENKLYIIGGYNGNEFKNDIYIYDFIRGKWSKIVINLIKYTHNLHAEILEYGSKKQIYILGSNNTQKHFYNKKLIFSLTDEPRKYEYKKTNESAGLVELSTNKLNKDEIFSSEQMKSDDYNFSYLGDYIPKIYDSLSDILEPDYTISMWLYIDRNNKDKTRMIMGDYDLCNGESLTKKYTCFMLHNNRILPCIKLDKKLLVKNNDEIPEVEYDKWFHCVVTIKNSEIETSEIIENFTSDTKCIFSENMDNTETVLENNNVDTDRTNNYEVNTYLNCKKTTTKFNTNLKFNENTQTLTVNGFESYNGPRKYANNTKLANLKIFNGDLDLGTIFDLYKNENNFYSNAEPELVYMDINTKAVKKLDYLLTGKNCVMQSFNKSNLRIISTNMELNYDITKGSYYDSMRDLKNQNVFDLLRLDNSIVKITINDKLISFTKDIIEKKQKKYKCPEGYYISKGNCIPCKVNTYSDTRNSLSCKKCPLGFTTNGKKGQKKCEMTENLRNKDTNIILNEDLTNYFNKKNIIYESAMEKVNEVNKQVSNMEKNIELLNKNIF